MPEQPKPGTSIRPIDEVRNNFERMAGQFKLALPDSIPVERFVRIVMTAVQDNADLLNCNRASLYGAAMKAAQDGLLPDKRESAMIVYNTNIGTKEAPKWEKQVQYQPMVEGLLKKVRNSGQVGNISVQVVKENDAFEFELGDNEKIIHKPARSNRGNTVGAYSIVTFKNGDRSREFMEVSEIESVRSRSKSAKSGPWVTDYDEMCRKTVFRRHYKRLPKSTDLDGVIKNDDDTFDLPGLEPAPAATTPHAQPVQAERPSTLQEVVDQDKSAPIEGSATRQSPPTDVI